MTSPKPGPDGQSVVSYRMFRFWRPQIFITFGIFGVVGVGMVAATIAGKVPAPTAGFFALWIAAGIWNAYWFLSRFAYQLDLIDGVVRWRTPLRNGTIALDDLRAVRPWFFTSQVEAFESGSGLKVLVFVRKGFDGFAREVQRQAPQVTVELGAVARVFQRFPGPTGLRRGSDPQ